MARRVALRARAEARRRAALVEKLAALGPARPGSPGPPESWAELHEEIARLPATERAAIVACDLEGLAHEEAAGRLGWSVRALRKRLYRGRERLRGRLVRRGLALAGCGIAAAPKGAWTGGASEWARGSGASPAVVRLAEGAMRSMAMLSLKTMIGAAVLGAAILVGGLWALGGQDAPKGAEKAAQAASSSPQRPSGRVAWPSDEEARALLRKAAKEATASGRDTPMGDGGLSDLAHAQREAGDPEGAAATYRKAVADVLAAKTPSAWDLWTVGHSQVESGDKRGGLETLARAVELAKGREADANGRGFTRVTTLEAIAKDQARAGDFAAARDSVALLRAACEPNGRPMDVFEACQFAGAATAAGEEEEAFREVLWLRSQSPTSPDNAAQVLGAMAEGLRDRDAASARPVVDRIALMLDGFALEPNAQVHPLSKLALAQARVGQIDRARGTASRIGRGVTRPRDDVTDTQPYALLGIARIQEDAGDRPGAIESLRLARKAIEDNPRMRGIDGRWVDVGLFLASLGEMGEARELAARIEVSSLRALLLVAIARAEHRRGQDAAAREASRKAIEATEEDPGMRSKPDRPGPEDDDEGRARWRAHRLAEVARMHAAGGDIAGARATLHAFAAVREFDELHAIIGRAYHDVAFEMACAGDLAGAVALAMEPRDADARRTALAGVGSGYRYGKKVRKLP